MSRIKKIRDFGQQIWLDALSREMWTSGKLARWIAEDGVAGVTTNPAILNQALQQDSSYRSVRKHFRTHSPEQCYEAMVLPDIRAACDLLRPLYEESDGEMGYVSFEVAPQHAHDALATACEAHRLWSAIDRPNAMIKIPATAAGVAAIPQVLSEGINVNATLIFSHRQAQAVLDAYLDGVISRLAKGARVDRLRAVVSVFISRLDATVDELLPSAHVAARGTTAIASAKILYRDWQRQFDAAVDFEHLKTAGAQPPLLLWGSTGTKNPAYSDVLYVEALIGPRTVNTVPLATLEAFRDHGEPAATLTRGVDDAAKWLRTLAVEGLADLSEIGERLQQMGLAQFEAAFNAMLQSIERTAEVA